MTTYEIIVTDVTCYGSLYCVAGWDRLTGRMIRPEPPGANAKDEASRFWNSNYAGPGKTFAVGNVVSFAAADALPDFLFPHATEDRIVDMGTPINLVQTLSSQGMAEAVAAGNSGSLTLAFDGALIRAASRKAYVPTGNRGRSLGAIEIPPSDITFFENQWGNEKPKLRARVTSARQIFDLSVPAEATRARWRSAGLAGLRADVSASTRLHIRTGLSRPGTKKVFDVRLHNTSQLSGFAKADDLSFFLREICDAEYVHEPLLAPTDDILKAYKRDKGDWPTYASRFLQLMADRKIESRFSPEMFQDSCLLCSEATPHHCHRKLVCEYLNGKWDDSLHVKHL